MKTEAITSLPCQTISQTPATSITTVVTTLPSSTVSLPQVVPDLPVAPLTQQTTAMIVSPSDLINPAPSLLLSPPQIVPDMSVVATTPSTQDLAATIVPQTIATERTLLTASSQTTLPISSSLPIGAIVDKPSFNVKSEERKRDCEEDAGVDCGNAVESIQMGVAPIQIPLVGDQNAIPCFLCCLSSLFLFVIIFLFVSVTLWRLSD